jgi:hypothetical protein
MAFLRRSLVLCVVLAGAAVLAGPTLAAAGPRGADLLCLGYPNQLGSPHFLVHYMSDNTPLSCNVKKAITETQAGDIAANNVLTLTPLSSTGAAAGTRVTRRVAIAPVKKPAKKRAR